MREDGYYWVRQDGIWRIAEWDSGQWLIHGISPDEEKYTDDDLDEINEMRIQPPSFQFEVWSSGVMREETRSACEAWEQCAWWLKEDSSGNTWIVRKSTKERINPHFKLSST